MPTARRFKGVKELYRVYWVINGQAREFFCSNKEERQAKERQLKEQGIEYGWQKVKQEA
jgi:hypothetical protein